MVRALLDGSKTQTRRVMKQQLVYGNVIGLFNSWYLPKGKDGGTLWPNAKERILATCPYGQPGERLWVREAWLKTNPFSDGGLHTYGYRATDEAEFADAIWKPSIHMPRVASRITLEVTSVRVERLQDISEADARAEGASQHPDGPWHAYRSLWTLINGPDSWAANPWVWAIEFKRIDQATA